MLHFRSGRSVTLNAVVYFRATGFSLDGFVRQSSDQSLSSRLLQVFPDPNFVGLSAKMRASYSAYARNSSALLRPVSSLRSYVPQYEHRRRRLSSFAALSIATPAERAIPVVDHFSAPCAGHFSTLKDSFVEEHRVRGAEVAPDQCASIVTIANLLQVRANAHIAAASYWRQA